MLFSADSKCSNDPKKWKANWSASHIWSALLLEDSDLNLYSLFEKEDRTFHSYDWRELFKSR
jgi:hypothetical protein